MKRLDPIRFVVAGGVLAIGCGDLQQAVGADDADGSGSGGGTSVSNPGDDGGTQVPDPDGGSASSDGTPPGMTTVDPETSSSGLSPGDSSDGSSSGPPPPGCGDGNVDPGEKCDDGDEDDTDECTTLCQPPSCEDGIRSGDETGPDCGGSCKPCGSGDGCKVVTDCIEGLECGGESLCAFPASCAALLAAWPDAPTASYPLDPEGDGTSAEFPCDMDFQGGGWTRLLYEDFAVSDGLEWTNSATSVCGNLGNMLGGYDNFAGFDVSRPVEVYGIPHGDVRLLARYIKIDSWDNETAYAEIDGNQVWSATYDNNSGPNNQCGGGWNDGFFMIDTTGAHAGATMTITFGSTLDDDAGNESWGVDNVEIWVR